ncbi:MAG: hypothetical protein IIA83_01645 [Thaumarchaeota archaeon]|nr:hypothetical protein [Nitrososphaerota archaeon]
MNSNYLATNIVKLVSISNQFRDMKMDETANALMKFPKLLGNNTVKISSLESAFEKVLKNAETEFGNRDEHSKQCIQMMLRHLKILFSSPKYDQALDELIEIMREREPTANTWRGLIRLSSREDQDYKERLIGLSQEYASKIEGLYKIDTRICYVLTKFAMGSPVKWNKISNTSIGDIKQYYNSQFADVSLFEGWSIHVRNAVAHSTYYYNEQDMSMKYEDKKAGWKKEFSHDEILEMSQKIMNVSETVDVLIRLIPIQKFSMIRDFEHFKLLGIDVICL